MKDLCERLNLTFDRDYRTKWPDYTSVTGDNTTPSESRFIHHTTITTSPPRKIDDTLLKQFTTQPGHAMAIDLLGFPVYWNH